jgi:hypothetical protein
VLLGKPNAYGSIFRFEGQASVFATETGPCYRCLYPEPPPPGLVPSCAEGGVLGILPGLVGVIQATEVIKLILGKGEPLIGRLLLVDALNMRFRELKLRKNPECPVCGENPTVTQLIDYQHFCGIVPETPQEKNVKNGIPQITVKELKARRDAGEDVFLLDVREPYEYQIAQIGGTLIPQNDVPNRLAEIPRDREIIVQCRSGARSQRIAELLQAGRLPGRRQPRRRHPRLVRRNRFPLCKNTEGVFSIRAQASFCPTARFSVPMPPTQLPSSLRAFRATTWPTFYASRQPSSSSSGL